MGFKEASIIKGENPDGEFKNIRVDSVDKLEISDLSIRDLLSQVVTELKINNQILNEAYNLDIKEDDIIGK